MFALSRVVLEALVQETMECLAQVFDEEILFSPAVVSQGEEASLCRLQVAVPAVVRRLQLAVEVPWAQVSLGTCFGLLQHQEEENHLEVVLN